MLYTGRDTEEREEQWLVFQETIAVTSSVKMPRPSSASSSAHTQGPVLTSPVKIDTTTSIEALKVRVHRSTNVYIHVAMVTD